MKDAGNQEERVCPLRTRGRDLFRCARLNFNENYGVSAWIRGEESILSGRLLWIAPKQKYRKFR